VNEGPDKKAGKKLGEKREGWIKLKSDYIYVSLFVLCAFLFVSYS